MTKPAKKRKGSAVQATHSVMHDIVGLGNKPINALHVKKHKKKRQFWHWRLHISSACSVSRKF